MNEVMGMVSSGDKIVNDMREDKGEHQVSWEN